MDPKQKPKPLPHLRGLRPPRGGARTCVSRVGGWYRGVLAVALLLPSLYVHTVSAMIVIFFATARVVNILVIEKIIINTQHTAHTQEEEIKIAGTLGFPYCILCRG